MAEAAFDPTAFSGTVPIFPLPNVVLFPGQFLPLHIFEPRYREMTADALQGEQIIAMALLKPGWEQTYAGSPPIHPIVGLGKIVESAKLEDGRYNLVLFGLVRARVIEEVGEGAYRRARVELLEEHREEGRGYDRKRRLLLALYEQVMTEVMKGAVPAPPEDVPLGMLCDLVASLIRLQVPVKQALLEELDAGARCDQLLSLLEGKAGSEPPPRPPRRDWPAGPSLN